MASSAREYGAAQSAAQARQSKTTEIIKHNNIWKNEGKST